MAAKAVDPNQAILDRIDALKAEAQPTRDEIKKLSDSLTENDEEIKRLELALSALRGEISTKRPSQGGGAGRTRRQLPDLDVTGDDVIRFLSEQTEPVKATQVREGLNVDEDIKHKLFALLGELADAEQISKTGKGTGTRYSAK